MTHPFLQLPYFIHSVIPATGLTWVENLSPTDRNDYPEYLVRVKRQMKGRTPSHNLLFRYDGEKFHIAEADGLPQYIVTSLNWRCGLEPEFKIRMKEEIANLSQKTG